MSTSATALLPTDAEQPLTPSMLAELRMQNDILTTKLIRLGRATRGLASELAAARRACRDMQRQLNSLRAENARLLAGSRPPRRFDVAAVRRAA